MLANGSVETYIAYAVLLALLVGVIQLVMGVARFGFLVTFLSHPVISGFTSAAALIIGFSQLKHLLGLDIPRSHHVHEILFNAAANWTQANPATLIIGAGSIVMLLLIKRWKPVFPGALVVVMAGTLAVWLLGLDASGVKIVGDVPAGLPAPQLPMFDAAAIGSLLPTAIAISMIGFMESISVAKAFARRNKYSVSPDQELISLGMANIVGSFFKAYPVTGGFSRTAVNGQAGANTQLSSIITAVVIALVLLFLTPLFYYLPRAVLAAIIMTAVFGLVDVHEARHLFHVKKSDFAALMVTFFATLTLGIEQGILIGVMVSLLWFVVRTTRPHVAVLGRLPGTRTYRNIANYPDAERDNGILVLRVDAQFYFGNADYLKDIVNEHIEEAGDAVQSVVIEAASVNQLDASADTLLREIAGDLKERGISLYFANVKQPVMSVMEKSGFDRLLGVNHFFMELDEAVRYAVQH